MWWPTSDPTDTRRQISMTGAGDDITQILLEVTAGKQQRVDELIQLLCRDLHSAASSALRKERLNHSLQPTALVNEVNLQLVHQSRVDWKNRSHFCAVAATLMRRILVDHARTRLAEKRGGGNPAKTRVVDPVWRTDRDERN